MSPDRGSGHPLARRAGVIALTVVVALAGAVGLLLYFNGRDDAGITSAAGPGREYADQGAEHLRPGRRPSSRYNADPPVSGAHVPLLPPADDAIVSDDQLLHTLELGNVVFLYAAPRGGAPPAPLVKLQENLSGPFDRTLVEGGQQVVIARRPGVRGILALAWRHQLAAPSAADPQLAEFADYWLGRGAAAK